MLHLILMVLAFVLFLVAGVGVSVPRVQLGWMGLASLTLGMLLGGK